MNRQPSLSVQAQRGFGLLEAIVALTILGSSAVALLAWVQQSRDTVQRVERVRHEAQLQLDAQAWLGTLNPSLRREGEVDLDGLRIRWTSEPLAPERDENDYNGNLQPVWRVGLYRLQVRASRGEVSAQWSQTLAGWRARDAVGLRGGAP